MNWLFSLNFAKLKNFVNKSFFFVNQTKISYIFVWQTKKTKVVHMPKIIKDIAEKKVSCNVSLPLKYVQMVDDFTRKLKARYPQLPSSFSRSDVFRILVGRHLFNIYKGSVVLHSYSKRDDEGFSLILDIMKEYGFEDNGQLDLFEHEQEPEDERKENA